MKIRIGHFRTILLIGATLGTLLVLLAWAKYRLLVIDHVTELYMLLLAGIFTAAGIWTGIRLTDPAGHSKRKRPVSNHAGIRPTDTMQGLSRREYEVLVCLASGLSTSEIAAQLFISENTIKTHLASVYQKLDVKRRTQAVQKARLLGLLAEADRPEV